MSTGTVAGVLLQLMTLGAIGWIVGSLVLQRFPDGDVSPVGPPERALAAMAGSVLFSVGLMTAHIITGGAIFASPLAVPVAASLVVAFGHRHLRLGGQVPWAGVAAALVVLGAIYVAPVLEGGSSLRTGDPPWHLGWTEQLLAGEPVPTGPAPEFGRNAYPWGLHALMATAVRLVPGSTPIVALEMLHLYLLAGIPLAAACLARRVRPDAGWTAAGAASLIGGFGWVLLEEPDFVTSPSMARYGADLVVASPNSVYELFPPALPRELGLVMLGAAAWLILASASSKRHNLWAVAGAAAGLVGILSVPLFVSALMWLLVGSVFVRRRWRMRWITTALASAIGVFALWAGPVISQALRSGGFVNITPRLGKEWDVPVALASWGLLLPLAVGGALLAARDKRSRSLVYLFGSSALLLLVGVARGELGWELGGNETLLHQGRMWPPAHLVGAALGGVALSWLRQRVGGDRRWLGPLVVSALLAVGALSPVLASRRLAEITASGAAGFEYGGDDLAPGSFARQAADYLGPGDVVEVRGHDDLAFLLFQLSGTKIATYDDPRLEGNDLRIRYADLADAYDEKMDEGGFEPTYLVLPAPELPYERALVRAEHEGRDWVLIQLNA